MGNIILFLETILFIYASFLAGNFILNLLKVDFSKIKNAIFSIMLGYGVFGVLGLILGMASHFNSLFLRFFFLLILITSFKTILYHLSLIKKFPVISSIRKIFRENTALKIIILIWIVANFLIVFVPITGSDTKLYHLPIMEDIVENERITFSHDIPKYKFVPLLAEILYAVPSVIFNNFSDPYIFQLIQFSALLMFLVLIYDFAKDKLKNSFLGPILVLAVLSIMDLQREVMHGGYIDVLMFLFAIAGTLIIIDNLYGNKIKRPEIYVSALLLGIAISMKYLALFFVGFNILLLLVYYLKNKINFVSLLKTLIIYFIIIFIIAGFWYAKNLIIFGNPVYPMTEDQSVKITEFDPKLGLGWWVTERNVPNMFLFPFFRYGKWFGDPTESSSQLVILAYFILIYSLIVFFAVARKKFRILEISLFSSIHMYMWILFFVSHQNRYLLGAIMLIPVLLIFLLDKLYDFFKSKFNEKTNKILMKISVIGAILVFLATFGGNIHFFKYKFLYLIGTHTEQEYILNIGDM